MEPGKVVCNPVIRSDWRDKLSRRDFAFYSWVNNLNVYITNKVDVNDVNWLNIPGYENILNAIYHEAMSKDVKQYPQQFMNLIPLFINKTQFINELIKKITLKTNAFDVNAVFNLVSIIDNVFSAFNTQLPGDQFIKYDYHTWTQSVLVSIKIDNSLCIAKFLWLYYKNAHLMTINHWGEICHTIFLNKFYSLFFHWSWQARNIFYYFILYIVGFRLKNKIPFKDREEMKLIRTYDMGKMQSYSGGWQLSFGEILEEKFRLITKLKEIIVKEHSDPSFNNIINPEKYKTDLEKIPSDNWKNIVISWHHFEPLYKEFLVWEKANTNQKDSQIKYPEIIWVTPKDDVVDYSREY